jgi:signal transduction histidine kinase
MKRYSTTVITHICAIIIFSATAFFAFSNRMPFTGILMILFIAGFGINLYRLQMIQLRLVKQLAQNISCGDTALSFRSKYRNAQLEELTDELREAMRMYKKRTMEANEIESWQKLIRVMGHEIMNSITPIISLSETLSTREVEYSRMQQGMQVIHKRSKGLLEFVENYRRITRIPAPVKEKVTLAELFNGIAELIPNDYISFAQPAPQISIKADRTQIEQVLINIIKNAIEACAEVPSPQIQVKSSVSETGAVSITVSDNGPGILPNVLDKIFIPFFTTKENGSGIGLSLCKQIMHLHGGNITARSTPEQGSEFTLFFN